MVKPKGQRPGLRALLLLVLEWLMFFLLFLPYVLEAFFRRIFPPKLKSLDEKVVLVTGAGRGLGKALALRFARHGCRVACVDIDRDSVLETASEIVRDGEKARAYFTNVAKVEEIKALRVAVTRDLGPVDILVNNASILYNYPLLAMSETTLTAFVQVNFLSYVRMVREFLPEMKERRAGHIVTISSLAAFVYLPGCPLYSACKWAITGLMESVRQEVLEEGLQDIHFTTVHPSFLKPIPGLPGQPTLTPRRQWLSKSQEEVAAHTLAAVRRNIVITSTPEYLYYVCLLNKVLPTRLTDWGISLIAGEGVRHSAESPVISRYDRVIKDTLS